jgi:hypothetical protein
MRARRIFLCAASAVAASTVGAEAAPFSCPTEIESDNTAGGLPQSFKFRYVSFFDGDPKDLADLAPEEGPDPKKLQQRWELTRSKDRPIVMICRYHGTDKTVRREVPLSIKECRLEGEMNDKGEVLGSPTLTYR